MDFLIIKIKNAKIYNEVYKKLLEDFIISPFGEIGRYVIKTIKEIYTKYAEINLDLISIYNQFESFILEIVEEFKIKNYLEFFLYLFFIILKR